MTGEKMWQDYCLSTNTDIIHGKTNMMKAEIIREYIIFFI